MTVEEQKILFADLFRLINGIRDELKAASKDVNKLLEGGDWESVTMLVNGISSEALLIGKMAQDVSANVNLFLERGPYEGQSAEYLPLERMAR